VPLLLGVLALVLVVVAGCGDDGEPAAAESEPTAGPGLDAATVALEQGRAVIDVRTPAEHADGHVDGATLLDVQDPSFDAAVAELDPEVDYVVYCRSGNRSATAAARMRAEGLDVLDGGALGDMAEAGWPVTTP
jgi:rhodanese-related sulfurtransferase